MSVVPCPSCGRKVQVKEYLDGCVLRCPFCKQQLKFPAAAAPVPPRAAAPLPKRAALAQDYAGSGGLDEDATLLPQRAPQQDSISPTNTEAQEQGQARSDGPTLLGQEALAELLAPPQGPGELGRLGGYRVLQVLGQGGMGVVFLAEDVQLQRRVALKALLPGLAADPVNRQRFLREARAAAAVEHDHIIAIHQVGEDRGVPFLAMPLLRGESLAQRLQRESRPPLAEVLRIGREIAEGLAAAHAHGLIHRDIKPANVWLEASPGRKSGESRVKILDFGLARSAQDKQLTQLGAVLGTPAYMSPEQCQGSRVDARSDLFSLGCVLYRLSTGELPFKGDDALSTLVAVATADPRPPRALNREVPPALERLIVELLAKKPDDRPASAQQVAEALEAAALPAPPGSKAGLLEDPTVALEQPKRQAGRRRALPGHGHRWIAIVGVGLLALGGLVWMLWPAGTQVPLAEPENTPWMAEGPQAGKDTARKSEPSARSEPLKETVLKKSDPDMTPKEISLLDTKPEPPVITTTREPPVTGPPELSLKDGSARVNGRLTLKAGRDKVQRNSYARVYTLKMDAARTYQIDMVSQQLDSYLRLEDPKGRQVAADDDGGGFPNARINYRCPSSGSYRIIATTYVPNTIGAFTLTVHQK